MSADHSPLHPSEFERGPEREIPRMRLLTIMKGAENMRQALWPIMPRPAPALKVIHAIEQYAQQTPEQVADLVDARQPVAEAGPLPSEEVWKQFDAA